MSIQSRAVENIVNRLIQTLLPFVKAEWTHVCGGAIISRRHVLTAAHCVFGSEPRDITVVAGTHDLAYRAYRHGVEKFAIHPDYREISSDIAIITIQENFLFGSKVQKIGYDGDYDIPPGSSCKFFGWGYLTPVRIGLNAFQLHGIELKTIPNEDCQAGEYAVTDTEICTSGSLVQGLCAVSSAIVCNKVYDGYMCGFQGDSGGALTTWDQSNIIGIASYSSQLCGSGLPDVFTRVSKFVDWIKENVEGPVSTGDKNSTTV